MRSMFINERPFRHTFNYTHTYERDTYLLLVGAWKITFLNLEREVFHRRPIYRRFNVLSRVTQSRRRRRYTSRALNVDNIDR